MENEINYLEREIITTKSEIKDLKEEIEEKQEYLESIEYMMKPVFDKDLYDNLSTGKYFDLEVKYFKKYCPDYMQYPVDNVNVAFIKFKKEYYFTQKQMYEIVFKYIQDVYKTKYWEFD